MSEPITEHGGNPLVKRGVKPWCPLCAKDEDVCECETKPDVRNHYLSPLPNRKVRTLVGGVIEVIHED
jgi:hypothetical protein